MQYPNVSGRGTGGCQQWSDVYYGRLLGVIEKEGKLLFKQDGRGRCAHFNTFPLPLTPPNTRTPYDLTQFKQPDQDLPPGRKFNFYRQLLYFYSNHTDVHLPVSVAAECLPPTRPTITKESADSARPTDHPSCCSTVTRLNDLLLWACGPDQRTLGVARLSPPTKSTCDTDSFLRWSQCHSSLSFHPLQALSMPAQIRHIQTAKIREKEYVGVRCAYHLCVLLVREGALEAVRVYQTQHLILLSALSPYVSEEFVVLTKPEGLRILSKGSKVTPIASSLHPQTLCYGAHPRSLVFAVNNKAYKLDWRTSPISTCVLFEAKDVITCLSHDPANLFTVFMCTRWHLVVVDLREPCRPLLSVMLEISQPPFFITFTNTPDEILLMLVSWRECTIVGVSRSPPLRTTMRPHLVVNLKAMHAKLILFNDDMSCLGKQHNVIYRLSRPLLGAVLWSTGNTHTSVIMTDLGDTFYQSWTYEDERLLSTPPILDALSCQGYNLWLEEAFVQETELAVYREMLPTGGRAFSQSAPSYWIMDYILSPEAPPTRLCVRCHLLRTVSVESKTPPHPLSPQATTTPSHCTSCGHVFNNVIENSSSEEIKGDAESGKSRVEELRKTIPSSEPACSLDIALMSAWTE